MAVWRKTNLALLLCEKMVIICYVGEVRLCFVMSKVSGGVGYVGR